MNPCSSSVELTALNLALLREFASRVPSWGGGVTRPLADALSYSSSAARLATSLRSQAVSVT